MPPNKVGLRLLNWASQLEDKTLEQARETASMPFVHPHVALMPDAHSGMGSAVGTVIPTLGAVIPAAVGVDIGCGMIGVRTEFTLDDLDGRNLKDLRLAIEASIPLSPGNYNAGVDRWQFTAPKLLELEELAARDGVELNHSPQWREQLGSLGGGNHFAELCLDETDRVWLFLHSGSRGVGNKIAKKHIGIAQRLCAQWWISLPNKDLAYLPESSREFGQYIRDLKWAQRFAYLNRAEMMDRFGAEFADWMVTDDHREVERINCHHNYTVKETHFGKDVWLTRKGAVDAHKGVKAIIPGSMGTRSYVVVGKGSKAGLCSAPHGAGRQFSRTEARKRFTHENLQERMKGIEFRDSADFIDEIPDAYKSIDVVMEDARDLVSVEHELRQILNVKGT
ncbi:RtcB family protein [Rhodococcus fascians]|uniref:RtcB family protein n=1 Tax=Rhodococcoides fascians TaxID=1828 RepID=UPI00195F52B1|nr:RtcB family protein [Rhodococcus fascians]MBM7244097.1 RtcB family protein [Rhodococcus fascians]MBY3810546.1 RtcB family protein [Rhodococcus fascians]MBY3841831.1 RtcB family protein [Rhodococcus fascians]MBY3844282.1 RtcB family protein [Rhodococcus fascians]MBY3850228.1 RtcB family protein [Rhodococcus fascians]